MVSLDRMLPKPSRHTFEGDAAYSEMPSGSRRGVRLRLTEVLGQVGGLLGASVLKKRQNHP